MSKKDNIPKGVRQEFEDVDYWHKLPKNKYVKLANGEKVSVYEYMKKFMHESYGNNFDRKDNSKNILRTKEQKQWATRNNNNTNRDALNVMKKAGLIASLFGVSEKESKRDTEEWENTFKIKGYHESAAELTKLICDELEIDLTKANVRAILKIYFRFSKFLTLIRRDQKNNKKKCSDCGKNRHKNSFAADNRTKDGKRKRCIQCEKA